MMMFNSRRGFWQQCMLAAIGSGRSAKEAAETADGALGEYNAHYGAVLDAEEARERQLQEECDVISSGITPQGAPLRKGQHIYPDVRRLRPVGEDGST